MNHVDVYGSRDSDAHLHGSGQQRMERFYKQAPRSRTLSWFRFFESRKTLLSIPTLPFYFVYVNMLL